MNQLNSDINRDSRETVLDSTLTVLAKRNSDAMAESESLHWDISQVKALLDAAARITMPKAMVRLSAGRKEMPKAVQALCFLVGANSIFYGDKLLTTGNPEADRDKALFGKLGLHSI